MRRFQSGREHQRQEVLEQILPLPADDDAHTQATGDILFLTWRPFRSQHVPRINKSLGGFRLSAPAILYRITYKRLKISPFLTLFKRD